MYAAHFNLRETPFSIAPDPAYLYMSPRHQEALGHLLYGTGQNGGFVQLTGEVGTGKTTVVRTLLAQKLSNIDVAIIHNPRQSEAEFVASICDELGVTYAQPAQSIKALVDVLNQHLLAAHAQGRRTVLIIDEAQNLSPAVLEQVRLLTNLETDKEKLLRIMLVGQPELIELLARPDLRQLASRITARYHLTPLSAAETSQYIVHRLRVAGGASDLFTEAALTRVNRYSQGVPRLINIICDRALLGAYARGLRTVTAEMVDRATEETQGVAVPTSPKASQPGLKLQKLRVRLPLRWIEGALAIAALIMAGVLLREHLGNSSPAAAPATAEAAAAPAAVQPPVTAPAPAVATVLAADAASSPPNGPQAGVSASTPATGTDASTGAAEADIGALRATAEPLPKVMEQLIGLWDPQIVVRNGENICTALSAHQLECYKDTSDLAELTSINRPAILTLNIPGDGTQYVLLRRVTSSEAILQTSRGMLRLPLDQLNSLWSGEFLLLWKRGPLAIRRLAPGSRGPDVVWIRQRLALAEGRHLQKPLSPVFDASLRGELISFQTGHGLAGDGVAGVRTLIALSEVGRAPGTPSLEDGG